MLTILCFLLGVSPSDLGRPRFYDRESATDRIAATWPASLPLLAAGTQHPDPEVRWRSERLLARLSPSLARFRSLLDPDVIAVLTTCPEDATMRRFRQPDKFIRLLDAASICGLIDGGLYIPENAEGIVWILACRAEAARRGQDKQLGSTSPPVMAYDNLGGGRRRWAK